METAWSPSGARRTSRRADPTVATGVAAARWSSWPMRRCATCRASGAVRTSAPGARPRPGRNKHGARPSCSRCAWRPARWSRTPRVRGSLGSRGRGAARARGPRWRRRRGQQTVRHGHTAEPALRRARPPGRGGHARPAAAPDGRRGSWDSRTPEIVAARQDHARAAEGGDYPFTPSSSARTLERDDRQLVVPTPRVMRERAPRRARPRVSSRTWSAAGCSCT